MADAGAGFRVEIAGYIMRACTACGGATNPESTATKCSCENPPPVEIVPVTATGSF